MNQITTQTDRLKRVKTDTTKTQDTILKFISQYGKVCRKILYINSQSLEKATIKQNITKLKHKSLLTENQYGTLSLTEKGLTQISTSKTET